MKTNYKKSILLAALSFMGWGTITNAQTIAAGGWHTYSICSDSTVKAWGKNHAGQLGRGDTIGSTIPVSVIGLTGVKTLASGGQDHCLAVKNNGSVWAWGSNLYGALGDGTTTNRYTPVQIAALTNITTVSAGAGHSVALKNNGTVWTWGWNSDGQLGSGTTTDRLTPAQVNGLSGIIAIEGGEYHTLALKSDGTVWTWGTNGFGQLGDGSTTNRLTPVQTSGLTGVAAIAGGRFFSLALKSNGTVWAWGSNFFGQLGDGTTTDRWTPVQASALTGIASGISVGILHSMALKNDGTVWTWGQNNDGQLGNGTSSTGTPHPTPLLVSGLTSVVKITAGSNFSTALKNNGTVWTWGRNTNGQLGDGSTTQRNSPVQVSTLCSVLQTGIIKHNESDGVGITAFPNPSSNGRFTLQMTDGVAKMVNGKIEIYNVMGEKVFQSAVNLQMINAPITIDLSGQPSGIYFMALKSGEHTFYQKLIKQ